LSSNKPVSEAPAYRYPFNPHKVDIYFKYYLTDIQRVLGSVVTVAFQITFCAEMHANDVFLFFKNHF
jgi:hypothetical protein